MQAPLVHRKAQERETEYEGGESNDQSSFEITNVAVMLLFYLTPVFYSLEGVGRQYRIAFTLNPMAALVQSYRAILYVGTVSDWKGVLVASSIAIAALGIGYLSYRREIQEVYDFL